MRLRLAVVVSHPIQHFAPWHREVAKLNEIDLKVFFCCDWGTKEYLDDEFATRIKWDIPLLIGYDYEFLPIRRRPRRLNYWQVDNPDIGEALDRFRPDVVKVFGYNYRTNWRVAGWTQDRVKPLMLYSDSNARANSQGWKRVAKTTIVSRFYRKVDGALFVGDNNRAYHTSYGLPAERLFPGALPIDCRNLLGSVLDRDAVRIEIRDRHRIPAHAFVVMFCGKFSARKRPLDLVIAAHQGAKSNTPVWALLVGEGAERARMEAYCETNDIRNVVFAGFINQSSVARYYAASDALAVTSEEDPHPLVVSEGAIFGLPVLVSDRVGCIGLNDTARSEVNALVYPCGDTDKLAKAIEELSFNNTLYRKMAASAVEIGRTQDVSLVAKSLSNAAHQLFALGPR